MEKRLDDLLKKLLAAIPEVKAAAIVSAEGLPIASALPRDIDETRIAAVTAALLSLSERAIIEMNKGDFDQLYIKGSNGSLLILKINPNSALILLADKDVRLGYILLDLRRSFGWDETYRSQIEQAISNILSFMKEDKLEIARKYLPEIISLDLLEFSSDGLPSLKSFLEFEFKLKGIQVFKFQKRIIFSKESR